MNHLNEYSCPCCGDLVKDNWPSSKDWASIACAKCELTATLYRSNEILASFHHKGIGFMNKIDHFGMSTYFTSMNLNECQMPLKRDYKLSEFKEIFDICKEFITRLSVLESFK